MDQAGTADAAIRVDEGTGTLDEASFFGTGPERLFGVLHRPAEDAAGGAVICPSLHAEFEKGYRSEVLLGRELAAGGLAAQRFHYRGMGHSDGDPAATTFETMVEDALEAASRVRGTVSGGVAFVGARWGALVAAAAAARAGDAPVAFWDPALRADEHFRNAFRARSVRRLRASGGDGPGEKPLDELRRTGVIDAVGYELHLALYESATRRTLQEELGQRPRRVLLVQIGRATELRTPYREAVERLRAGGSDVETRIEQGEEGSWFVQFGERYQPEVDETERALLDGTSRWIEAAVA